MRRSRSGLAVMALAAASCASKAPVAEPSPHAEPTAAPAAGIPQPIDAASTHTATAPPPVDTDGPEDVDGGITGTQKAVLDSRFQDIDALVGLARLQLLRDAPIADQDGPTDAERARKNAMRAIAVDDTSTGARVVLVIALARSFERGGVGGSDGALSLLQFAGATIPPGTAEANAAADVVRGTLHLARGDQDKAEASFETAARSNPKLAAAWAGLGDVARSRKKFDEAASAYRKAAEIRSTPELTRSLEAAERREVLDVRSTRATTMSGAPLAPPRTVATCPTSVANATASAAMCRGVGDLAKATTAKEKEAAATAIVDAWSALDALCDDKDPACGPYVASSLAAASRAFGEARLSAKAIATARLVLQHADAMPKSEGVVAELTLELGDRYFGFCMFDEAAIYYERAAKLRAPGSKEAGQRAAFIRAAFKSVQTNPKKEAGCSGPLCGLDRLLADKSWVAKR